MVNLEEKLNEAKNSRYRVIVADGVFSMDGTYAKLPEIALSSLRGMRLL